ncbi:hypothetical protein [Noviherbaspirillum galbum]|uniref:Uncharacterized protein n=1 Tax=Noviherbaspirillum galbum TaxID=2709383 RepID=A0A6B3SXH1_9BURK|nr:hypothetical protein [Noviherbaspirillum galbum]NEX64255.1 hypothetical protein [Noviherbaspirillum galbum]
MKDSLRKGLPERDFRQQPDRASLRHSTRKLLRNPLFRGPMSWLAGAFGMVWALPLTLAGVALALPVALWRGKVSVVRGRSVALLVRGPLADFLLGHHPFGAMTAMALGHVIVSEAQGLSARVLAHELVHVRQAEVWGPFFPIAYLASSALAALQGKDAYWHNHFEIAARKAEKHI